MKPQPQTKQAAPTTQAGQLKRLPLIAGAAFALLTWALLNIFEHEFLFRVQELSLWLPTKVYFDERMMVPGGLLTYIASFLTQFFYYPILGSLIYVALLMAVQLLTQKVFAIPNRWALLALLPGALILCCSMEAGYWIFQIKTQGYFYSMLVGFLFTLSATRLYQLTKSWGRYLAVALIAAAGYPLFGFYALLALLTIVALELASKERSIGIVLLCIAAGIATPILYYNVYEQTRFARMFTAGMPAFEFILRDLRTWIPYILLYLLPLVIPFIPLCRCSSSIPQKRLLIESLGGSVIIIVLVQFFWFRDPNFRAEIKMNHHMERLEWTHGH